MRVADVRKKYPEFFATVEAAVWDDSRKSCHDKTCTDCKRIAYNAAAVSTLELRKIIIASRKKSKVAGKTSNNSDYASALKTSIAAWCMACGAKVSGSSIRYLVGKIQRLHSSTNVA